MIKDNYIENKKHYEVIAKLFIDCNTPCDFGLTTYRLEGPASIDVDSCENYRDTIYQIIHQYNYDLKSINVLIRGTLGFFSVNKCEYYTYFWYPKIRNLELEYPIILFTEDIDRYINENKLRYIDDLNFVDDNEDFVFKLDENWYMVLKDEK